MFTSRTNWSLKPNRLFQALERHKSSGRRLLDLSASNPTECGFQYDAPAILGALSHPASLEYHPEARGLESARQAVSGYYAARGDQISPNDLLLTVSTSEAYSHVFRLLSNPGDELLVPTPSYPLFDFLADVNDVKLARYPLFYDHGWHIDLHTLEQSITPQTRGIIVVHPNNPTGHYTRTAEMTRLNQLCAAREMAIIADEVFLDFAHNDFEHNDSAHNDSARTDPAQNKASPLPTAAPKSFAANDGALTFTMSGVSKISGLPQMKLAWLVVNGPQDLKREALARLEMIADTYLSLSAPIQLAAPVLLAQQASFQRQLMARVRRNLSQLDSQLAQARKVSRLEIEGGWYAVLRVPAIRPDEELAIELVAKHDVYVHPGHFYDFPGDGYLVVSLITPELEFKEGLRRLLLAV
jgi:alanine-synthesizing transaminase